MIHITHILSASFISFGIIVTRFVCIAHKLVSSNRQMRKASAASCIAKMVAGVSCISNLICWRISLTSWRNGSFLISSSVVIWNFLISLSATVPSWNQYSLFNPPVALVPLFYVSFVIKCFGPSIFLTVVFFVLAIF